MSEPDLGVSKGVFDEGEHVCINLLPGEVEHFEWVQCGADERWQLAAVLGKHLAHSIGGPSVPAVGEDRGHGAVEVEQHGTGRCEGGY